MSTTTHASTNGVVTPTAAGVLTLAEAAELLRVSEDGLRADAVADRVPGRLVAGEWRFWRDSLLAWLGGPSVFPRTSHPLQVSSETDEEFEKYQDDIRAYRDEIDRATGSGKYAPE